MSRQNQKSSWPLLCILACLFILSAVAPRSWERIGRNRPIAEMAGPEGSFTAVPAASPGLLLAVEASPPTTAAVPSMAARPAPAATSAQIVDEPHLPLLLPPQGFAAAVVVKPAGKIAAQFRAPAESAAPEAIEAELTAARRGLAPTASQLASMLGAVKQEETAGLDVDDELIAAPAAELSQKSAAPAVVEGVQPPIEETGPFVDLRPWDEADMGGPIEAEPAVAVIATPAPSPPVEPPAALGDWVAREHPLDEPNESAIQPKAVRAAPAPQPRCHIPQPATLRQGLENLSCECETGLWAMDVLRLVDKLLDAMSVRSDEAPRLAAQLSGLADVAPRLADRLDDDMLARRMRQTAYNLQRRVHLWQAALGMLGIEEAGELLEHVERFEQSGLVSDARRLTEDWQRLKAAAGDDRQQLGAWLEDEYRNANFRTVITGELLNRLPPQPQAEYGQVNDTILGMPVRGQSVSASRIGVQLVPNANQMRMKFLVAGSVNALTSSDMGVAKFYDRSDSVYYAGKDLFVDAGGIRLFPAEVSVRSSTQLRGVKTSLDPIPLVGWLAQNVARTQHELFQPMASAEAEQKISAKAKTRVDTEVYARLNSGAGQLRQRLFVPLERLGLPPEQISAETTAERMTMRLRLAGDDQSGGYTPRPRALSDSLLSLQVNETAINNVLAKLQLDGRTFTLPELSKHVADKLNRPDAWPCDTDHADVEVTFAQKDPIFVRCRHGQLELTLSIARLAKAPRQWKDFQVRVAYRPEVNGRSAELVRDGVVQLISTRLNNAGQIAVRGIFSRTFSKNHRWNLTPAVLAENPGLADTAITQFEIDEGWMALALGPQSTLAQISPTRR